MAQPKKYTLDEKIYTIPDLVKLTGLNYGFIRHRLKTGATKLNDITKTREEFIKRKNKVTNWRTSMMNDELGHWKLINKALQLYDK